MSKSQSIRDALLAGETLTAPEVAARFECSVSMLPSIIKDLRAAGHVFETQRLGGIMAYTHNGQERAENRVASPPPRLPQPLPGDTLHVTGLFLEAEQIAVQARSDDGTTYLLHVTAAQRAGKGSNR